MTISVKKYVASGGVVCPFCLESNLHGGDIDVDEGRALQNIDCHSCGASWTDVYTLTGIDNAEKGGKE